MYFIPGKIEFLNEGGYLNIKKIKSHVTNLEREQTERERSLQKDSYEYTECSSLFLLNIRRDVL